VIARDKTFFRAALSSQLQVVGAQVIAAYEHAEELPARLLHDPPDVVLLDVRMPPTNTDEGVTRRHGGSRRRCPGPACCCCRRTTRRRRRWR
jgi:DNA-binding NarL/FixJ family response regulator